MNNAPITAPPPELSDEQRATLLKFREKLTSRLATAEAIARDIAFQKKRGEEAEQKLEKLLEEFDPDDKKALGRIRALEDQVWAANHVIERFGDRPETSREDVENTLRVGVEVIKRALRETIDQLHEQLATRMQLFYRDPAAALAAAKRCCAGQSYLLFLTNLSYRVHYKDAEPVLGILNAILDEGRIPWVFTPEPAVLRSQMQAMATEPDVVAVLAVVEGDVHAELGPQATTSAAAQ